MKQIYLALAFHFTAMAVVISADLRDGMVSYWPLNEVQGTKTPDVVSGYDMELVNMTAANVVDGKWGKAFKFENAKQTMLERVHLATDQLPIYKYTNFTVSLWVNGSENLQDLRIFCESSTKATQPMFSIGTPNNGQGGSIDSYIRTDGNTQGGHKYSTLTALDGAWHHVVHVQREAAGVIEATLYIDGVKDDMAMDPRRPLTVDATAIGGIRRATRTFWFTGMIDDVAVWKRALDESEISTLFKNGTPTAQAVAQPLAVRSFRADLPAVARGDSNTLRWDVSKDATKITIDQGIGDVTAKTVVGIGSLTIPITDTKTYTITITRGSEVLTVKTAIAAVDGIGAEWALLDNFETYAVGAFGTTGYWGDTRDNAKVVDLNGNKMLDLRGTDHSVILPLRDLTVKEGQQRTLFTRFLVQGDLAETMRNFVGLTDRNFRYYSDFNDAGGFGPVVIPSNQDGELMLGIRNGVGATLEFEPTPLEADKAYNLWIDIKNNSIAAGDTLNVYIQKLGETSRRQVFKDYSSDRNPDGTPAANGGGPTLPDLDKLIVGNNGVNSLLFDEFYITKSGYNSSVPFGQVVAAPLMISINRTATELEIRWTNGTLESASTVIGPWSAVAGASPPAYKVTSRTGQQFFRIRR